MPSSAKLDLLGHVGREPEMRYTGDGTAVTTFSLATNRKEKDELVTDWWGVVAFGKTAELVADRVKKGSLVYASGRAQIRKYTTKEGVERTATEVVANTVLVLSKTERGDGDDELPF